MKRTYNRAPAAGHVYLVSAAVFAVVGLAVLFGFGQDGLRDLWHPAPLLLAGIPWAAAGGLALLARRTFRHRPEIVVMDADGIGVAGGPLVAWSHLDALIVTTIHVGYGPTHYITLRRRHTPSDIAAKAAERVMHNLFTDRGFAPGQLGLSVEEMLRDLDAAMAGANYRRIEPPERRFRGLLSTRTWKIRPGDARR